MTKTLIIFCHEVNTENVYCWNGEWPILILGTEGWNGNTVSKQEDGTIGPAPLDQTEEKVFRILEGNKNRVFQFKDRGRFTIIQRIKLEINDEN
jgi:hypothetical protein